MKFNKKELLALFRAIKIMQSGEELLGIDVDKKIVDALAERFQKEINTKFGKKIDREIASLIKEAREFSKLPDYRGGDGEYGDHFDRDFGPNYPYSSTLEILNQAIENDQKVEINYFSANQGKFTKRKVKPENIERRSGTPYLNAYCYLRNDERVFKLSRIKDIKMVKGGKK